MTTVPRTWAWGDPVELLRQALLEGAVLALPTESTYGLAADPRSRLGVERVMALKGRDAGKPLPVVGADLPQLEELGVDFDHPLARALARAWPAPLSLVLPLRRALPAAAGGTTLAVRVPAHRQLRRLLRQLGMPLTATSANRSGKLPATRPDELLPLLTDREAWLIDDGKLPGGPPSTLIQICGDRWTILRQGAYTEAEVRQLAPGAG